jgi:hypothetical protein
MWQITISILRLNMDNWNNVAVPRQPTFETQCYQHNFHMSLPLRFLPPGWTRWIVYGMWSGWEVVRFGFRMDDDETSSFTNTKNLQFLPTLSSCADLVYWLVVCRQDCCVEQIWSVCCETLALVSDWERERERATMGSLWKERRVGREKLLQWAKGKCHEMAAPDTKK